MLSCCIPFFVLRVRCVRSFFTKEQEKAGDSAPAPGDTFLYEEDWGEKYDGVSRIPSHLESDGRSRGRDGAVSVLVIPSPRCLPTGWFHCFPTVNRVMASTAFGVLDELCCFSPLDCWPSCSRPSCSQNSRHERTRRDETRRARIVHVFAGMIIDALDPTSKSNAFFSRLMGKFA